MCFQTFHEAIKIALMHVHMKVACIELYLIILYSDGTWT